MDSFKTATSLAKHAVDYEALEDAKADVRIAEMRLFAEENALRKRLRTMRKRTSHCSHFTSTETARSNANMERIRSRLAMDKAIVERMEKRVRCVIAGIRLPVDEDATEDEAEIHIVKRRRLIARSMTADFLTRDDLMSHLIPFLSVPDAFRGLAFTSARMSSVVRSFAPRMAFRRYPSFVHQMKSLTHLTCNYITAVQLQTIAPQLESLTLIDIDGGAERLMQMQWPRLQRLSVRGVGAVPFWEAFRPAAMPRLVKVALKPGCNRAMLSKIRALMQNGELRLDSFPSMRVQRDGSIDDYLWIHNHIGTTEFALIDWFDDDVQRFKDAIPSERIVSLRTGGCSDVLWMLGLPNLRKLEVTCSMLPMVPEDISNTTVRELKLAYTGHVPATAVSFLRTFGPQLTKVHLDIFALRPVMNAVGPMGLMQFVKDLTLTTVRRAVFQIPLKDLPALRRLTVPYLNDTQTYVVIGDILNRKTNRGLHVIIPSFVSNRVASILYHYEKTAKHTVIQIKGYQSNFYNIIMQNSRLVEIDHAGRDFCP